MVSFMRDSKAARSMAVSVIYAMIYMIKYVNEPVNFEEDFQMSGFLIRRLIHIRNLLFVEGPHSEHRLKPIIPCAPIRLLLIYFNSGFTLILGDNLHCGFSH